MTLDGLSVYVLDWTGCVQMHRVENLVKGRGGRKREIEWELGREWGEVRGGVPSGVGGYWGWEEREKEEMRKVDGDSRNT